MNYQRNYVVKKELMKDVRHKKLSGVCAGIAKYYHWPRLAVRAVAIIALLMFPLATGVAYLIATLLLPDSD